MAHVKINRKELEKLLGRKVEDEELHEKASFLGAHWNHIEGDKWDVEIYPNRPDLLSVEGLARAYRGFLGVDPGREDYSAEEGDITVEVEESVEEVRPFIGAAVVRGVDLDERTLNGLIETQEKMHETMGRRRDKLAIGLHDLSTVEPPFTYRAVEPEKVEFTPLEYDNVMQLGEILDEHEKGKKYSWILEDEDLYPVIIDSDDRVFSFPPITNSQLTEVHNGTDDIFIDVTGKDRETVKKALVILATALSERGGTIETVEVDGEGMPDLSPEEWKLDLDYFNKVSGLDLTQEQVVKRLKWMKHGAEMGEKIQVEVPCYRTDLMHQYDLIEDVVIAHGYHNIEPELPDIDQAGEKEAVEEFTDIIREILVGTGALESNTYYLSNREKLFEKMEVEPEEIAEMSNPLTRDYTAVRNWLLPSLLEVLENNRHHSYPQRFFEVADTVLLDDSSTGASNRRKLAYIVSGSEIDYTDARETLQVLERDLGIEFDLEAEPVGCFDDQRSAEIYLGNTKVGMIGQLSEQVLENWELDEKTAAFELDVEKLMDAVKNK